MIAHGIILVDSVFPLIAVHGALKWNYYLLTSNTDLILASGERFREQRRWALHTLRDFGFGRSTIEDTIREELVDLCRVLEPTATEDNKAGSQGAQSEPATAIDPTIPLTRSVFNVICTVLFGARLGNDPKIERIRENLNFILYFEGNRAFLFYLAKYLTFFLFDVYHLFILLISDVN